MIALVAPFCNIKLLGYCLSAIGWCGQHIGNTSKLFSRPSLCLRPLLLGLLSSAAPRKTKS